MKSEKVKTTTFCRRLSFFGWGIGIRTPTNRVRVCRATVTQFPNIWLFAFFSIIYYILFFGYVKLFLKKFLKFEKSPCNIALYMLIYIALGGIAQLGAQGTHKRTPRIKFHKQIT